MGLKKLNKILDSNISYKGLVFFSAEQKQVQDSHVFRLSYNKFSRNCLHPLRRNSKTKDYEIYKLAIASCLYLASGIVKEIEKFIISLIQ